MNMCECLSVGVVVFVFQHVKKCNLSILLHLYEKCSTYKVRSK